MQSRLKQHAASTTLLMTMIGASQVALSEPVINDYSVAIDHKSDTERTLLVTVQGQGFGEKTQPEPVLWVFGNDVRQNGERAENPTYQIGESVEETGPSIWNRADQNVIFDPLTRYSGLAHSYFTGQDGTVGDPLAFGGTNPPYSDRTYLSARIKPTGSVHDYRAIAFSELSGNFDIGESHFHEGETITIDGPEGKVESTFIGIDKDAGTVTITGNTTRDNTLGAIVTGKNSGATLKLHSDQTYQVPGASKYLRMWSGGKPGLYATMSTRRLLSAYRTDDGSSSRLPYDEDGSRDRGYGIPDMTSNLDWRLLEVTIDQSDTTAITYLDIDNENRRYIEPIDIDGVKLTDRSPTISQLGWDAAGGRKDVHVGLHFGEIYFDTTPQRVMLSTQSKYTAAGNELELQYPIKWSENEIIFEVRAGELDIGEDLYAYIFDETSTPNRTGYSLCISCALGAPEATTLSVE